ncbi:hypothetical protein VTK26DRAFT_2816 [Humicola hyalothermophila]
MIIRETYKTFTHPPPLIYVPPLAPTSTAPGGSPPQARRSSCRHCDFPGQVGAAHVHAPRRCAWPGRMELTLDSGEVSIPPPQEDS